MTEQFKVCYLTVRVNVIGEHFFLNPQLVVRRNHQRIRINGWHKVKSFLDKHSVISHEEHIHIFYQLYELKQKMTCQQLLIHPEGSELLLRLNELNKGSRWLEHLIRSLQLKAEREMFPNQLLNK
jgi:hypothetical protein